MAATFADIFLGYEIIRSLCGFLYCDDIINVTLICKPVHSGLIADNRTVETLFQFALRCDGPSSVVTYFEHPQNRGGKSSGLEREDIV